MFQKFNFDRFKKAQENVEQVKNEFTSGKKEPVDTWVPYLLPVYKDYSKKNQSKDFEINSIDECKAYLGNKYFRKNTFEITNLIINEVKKAG